MIPEGKEGHTTIEKQGQLLSLLKRRYSYTNEKAVAELVRLLKQFSGSNKSLRILQALSKSWPDQDDQPETGLSKSVDAGSGLR
jgi:hypothetical protein